MRRRLLSTNEYNSLTLSMYKKTVGANASSLTLQIYYGETQLKSSDGVTWNISQTDNNFVNGITWSGNNILVRWESNTNQNAGRNAQITFSYNGSNVTFTLTQNKDSIIDSWKLSAITNVSFTSLDVTFTDKNGGGNYTSIPTTTDTSDNNWGLVIKASGTIYYVEYSSYESGGIADSRTNDEYFTASGKMYYNQVFTMRFYGIHSTLSSYGGGSVDCNTSRHHFSFEFDNTQYKQFFNDTAEAFSNFYLGSLVIESNEVYPFITYSIGTFNSTGSGTKSSITYNISFSRS